MSLAWYIVLEGNIPGFEPFANGKAAAHAGELLDSIAEELGVLPLSHFFSISAKTLAAFAADHRLDLNQPGKVPPELWFSPGEGLRTLQTLIEAALKRKIREDVIEDLRGFQVILQAAEANRTQWHLAVDF